MSDSNLGGCQPLAPPKGGNVFEPIRAMVHELGPGKLGPEDYRGVVVPLVKELASTDSNGSQTFRAPTTHNFVIEQIIGHVALVGLASETLDLSAVMVGDFSASPMLSERVLMKAMNARITLQNSDRAQKLIEGGLGSLSLAAILPMIGGRVIDWSAKPHIVPAGESLELTVTLQQTTASIKGGATEYGVILVGSYIRVKAS